MKMKKTKVTSITQWLSCTNDYKQKFVQIFRTKIKWKLY